MLLHAALNGPYSKSSHPVVPVSANELTHDARLCVAEGARAIHLHPRDTSGFETLDPRIVDHVVAVVKDACGVPVGVSAGMWIEPDLDRRIEAILSWRAPDHAVVDIADPDATQTMEACLEAGVGVEAALATVEDVEMLALSGLGSQVLRVLIGPLGVQATDALALAVEIHTALDRYELRAPRLQFGDGDGAWPLVTDAINRGIDTRIGFEDTIHEPSGEVAASNAALIRAAIRLRAGRPGPQHSQPPPPVCG